MSPISLPLLIEPDDLEPCLGHPNLLLVDLCRPEQYAAAHIPGAIYLPFTQLMSGHMPGPGKLPSTNALSQLFSALGLTPDTHVVAYDDEGGGWAGRLIWTLDMLGHPHYSYLNGGLHAWAQAQKPLEEGVNVPIPSTYQVQLHNGPSITKDEILQRLELPNFVVWDARSPEEYLGLRQGAAKNGHIPGAVNYEWVRAMDRHNGLRIRDHNAIRQELAALGITADKHIVTHCQSHHRSGFTYLLGKILGFEQIQAYPGSWSEWGNDPDTPVETGAPEGP
ncbi:sulfurtransferase [Ketobacter sp.]|uniref:sulfurtransferase n=1 Tax=Ketobacter sp. TaxID=2083498 RepID=UPI000F184DC0|nr:rhodanese-like domain-containing protein [Ketobacter sp.]RLT92156.1 MAG: sulfurtransferase [Ketobacter sp.]